MIEIAPTILANDIASFNQFFDVYKGFAKRISIDVTDGEFANFATIDLSSISIPTDWQGSIDLHMMVMEPSKFIPAILKLHPSLCIFHAECHENLLPIFEQLSNAGIKTGVGILRPTYPGDIKPYLETADHVLIFAGALTDQGNEADLLQLEKVEIIKNLDPNIEIGWSGGANIDNVRAIAHSDVNVINVGNVFRGSANASETYNALLAETEKQGVNI